MRFARCLLLSLCCLSGGIAIAEDPVAASFEPYSKLLDRHLVEKDLDNDGLISAFDYRGALDDEGSLALLGRQREKLAEFDIHRLDSREKANAFWLNAYNFFMIAHVLEEKPDGELIETVWDYGGRYNPLRRNVFERALFDVGGKKYSLDNMEKDILLGEDYWEKGWAEARVHFAVNCASVSCPPLRKQIYTPDNLDELLSDNTRRALNTAYHLKLDGDSLYLSRLFDWYEEDYKREAGSVRDFIRQHADESVIEKLDQGKRIRYLDYDWRLNKPANFREFQDRNAGP